MKSHLHALATLTLLGSVSHGIGAATPTGTILSAKEVPWTVEAPGPRQTANLWGDRNSGAAGVLVKVPGGWKSEVQDARRVQFRSARAYR
jgi:hypothetical protein